MSDLSDRHGRWPHPPFGRGPARFVVAAVVGLTLACFFALLFGGLVMWLWNRLMPGLFHVAAINYWQAFGLIVLARLLLGWPGGRMHGHRPGGRWRRNAAATRGDEAGDDSWGPCGAGRDWRYYGRWWREEGRAAFAAYAERRGSGGPAPDKPE